MNVIEQYKRNGVSVDGERNINMIVGCILGSQLDNGTKRELANFMRALEEYLEND